jgi:hypothetical protein
MVKGIFTSKEALTRHLARMVQRIQETYGINAWFADESEEITSSLRKTIKAYG